MSLKHTILLLITTLLANAVSAKDLGTPVVPNVASGNIVAWGSDNRFWELSSSLGGYKFKTVEPVIVYLNASEWIGEFKFAYDTIQLFPNCTGNHGNRVGNWASDQTGTNIRLDYELTGYFTFKILSTSISPMHNC